jgi:lipopolysaccharide export system permease protein
MIRLPWLLAFYLARRFLFWWLALGLCLLGLLYALDAAELLRRLHARGAGDLALAAHMAWLKAPKVGRDLLPLVTLFAGLASFWRLEYSNELTVMRAAGLGTRQIIVPSALIALMLGLACLFPLAPTMTAMLADYERLESAHIRGEPSSLDLAASGLWLRCPEPAGGFMILHGAIAQAPPDAAGALPLQEATLTIVGADGLTHERLDAVTARLGETQWLFEGVWHSLPGTASEQRAAVTLPACLSLQRIEQRFAPPETLPLWRLSGVIDRLERAGLSSLRHRLHWHEVVALPFSMVAMTVLAAAFALRRPDAGRVGRMGATALALGCALVLFVLRNLLRALVLSEALPPFVAIWGLPLILLTWSLAALLRAEEG